MSTEENEAKESEIESEETSKEAAETSETAEEQLYAEYKVSSPELLQIMLDAFDILERASEGSISVTEAKALYDEKVVEALEKLGSSVKRSRRSRTPTASAQAAKKVAKKKVKKVKRSKAKRRASKS